MDNAVAALSPHDTALETLGDGALVPGAAAAPQGPPSPLQRLRELPPRNKWLVGAGVAALLALMVWAATMNRGDSFAPLFPGSLADKDAGAIIAQLKKLNVPYRIEAGTILVPEDRKDPTRMTLAEQGLPRNPVSGYELLDTQRFGQSQQQERMTVQRAIEGELIRSIGSINGVEQAHVHLALAPQNGFYREQSKPSASVQVFLRPGRMLDRGQIAGIVHLVSKAVVDLSPKDVVITDGDGSLLTGDGANDARQDLTQQQRQHIAQVEAKLLKRVQEILEPAVGRDNLRATVTADVDFSETEQASESYRPNQKPDEAAIRSQSSLETQNSGQLSPTGVPGAASNQPPTPAAAPMTGASAPLQPAAGGAVNGNIRRQSAINYEVDKTVRNTRNASHPIKRVNVAVLVNYRETKDAKGKTSTAAPPQEELDKLTALVQEAVGYDKERGDSVKLAALPFRAPDPVVEPPLWKQPWLIDLLKASGVPAALLAAALLLVFGVIRPALKKEEPPPEPEPDVKLDEVVGEDESLPEIEEGFEPDDPLALEAPKIEARLVDAREMAKANPLAVANILQAWMIGEEPDLGNTPGSPKT